MKHPIDKITSKLNELVELQELLEIKQSELKTLIQPSIKDGQMFEIEHQPSDGVVIVYERDDVFESVINISMNRFLTYLEEAHKSLDLEDVI